MKAPSFEIKVALLGHVSVGKTTLLNALLGDKFSEVSKRRTTAGITHFSISPLPKPTTEILDDEVAVFSETDEDDTLKDNFFTSQEILEKITNENLDLRKKSKIQECTVNVEVDTTLIPMRQNTKLVITDIPGVNEADTSNMYLDYVENTWDTFDCVIIVMDAAQGVNTNEQVQLLQFAKTNIEKSKDVPLIILCNKVDDTEDQELITLVDEVRSKVEHTFEVKDRIEALLQMIETSECKISDSTVSNPAFLTLSAENAFVYRAASRLERNELHKLGKAYIDKIGHEEVGKVKWKRLSQEKRYDVVYDAVKDSKEYEERLSSSNFDKFLRVLDIFIGGSEVQANLIEKQMKIEMKKLAPVAGFTNRIQAIFDRSVALGKSTIPLKDTFWNLYQQYKDAALEGYKSRYSNLHLLYGPMKELDIYASHLHLKLFFGKDDASMKSDKDMILSEMRELVTYQCDTVIEKEASITVDNIKDPWTYSERQLSRSTNKYPHTDTQYYRWRNNGADSNSDSSYGAGGRNDHPEADKYASHWYWDDNIEMWKSKYNSSKTLAGSKDMNPLEGWVLSPRDWNNIFSMLLMMKCYPQFCKDFGKQISNLEWRRTVSTRFNNPSDMKITVDVPDAGPIDVDHWGHLIWKYLCIVKKGNLGTSEEKRGFTRIES